MPNLPQNNMVPQKEKEPSNQKGSGFVNLQKYLNANQGNKLGQNVLAGVQGTISQTNKDVEKGQTQFQQGLQQASSNRQSQEQLAQNTLSKFNQPGFTDQTIGQNETQGFNNLRNSKYQGPQGIQNESQLQIQADKAQQLGQFGGTSQGRQELLRQFAGRNNPQYTGQKQRLDELLLGLGGGAGALKQAAQESKNLSSNIKQQLDTAKGQAESEALALQQLKDKVSNQIIGLKNPLEQAVINKQQELLSQQQARQGSIDSFKNMLQQDPNKAIDYALQQGLVNQDQANQFKLLTGYQNPETAYANVTTPTGELLNAIDFGKLATDKLSVSTPEQRAQLNALARLMGGPEEYVGQVQQNQGTQLTSAAKGLGSRVKSDLEKTIEGMKSGSSSTSQLLSNIQNQAKTSTEGVLADEARRVMGLARNQPIDWNNPRAKSILNRAGLNSIEELNDPNKAISTYAGLGNIYSYLKPTVDSTINEYNQRKAENEIYNRDISSRNSQIEALKKFLG